MVYGIVCVAVLITFVAVDLPVARRRVEVFAFRQDLTVTAGNAPGVITYLARARRWRAAGLVGGITWYTVGALRHDTIGVNLGYALVGWFLGALVAETRMSGPVRTRSAASLTRRSTDRYVSPTARALLPGAAIACFALAVSASAGPLWLPLAAAIGLPTLVALVGRRIRLRPQPVAASDVLAADEAIRSRSLRALTACAITLLLYCVVDEVVTLLARVSVPLGVVALLAGAVAVPATGWRLARMPVSA